MPGWDPSVLVCDDTYLSMVHKAVPVRQLIRPAIGHEQRELIVVQGHTEVQHCQ